MLSRFAHVLLVATSLAPVALIFGISRLRTDSVTSGAFIGAALGLCLTCHMVLWFVATRGEVEQITIVKSKSVDREALAFLVTYALPLVVPVDRQENILALVAFVAVVFLVLFQLQLVHVNPLLALFRYHFFEVNPPTGETAILITKGYGAGGLTRIVKLSTLIWLELPR